MQGYRAKASAISTFYCGVSVKDNHTVLFYGMDAFNYQTIFYKWMIGDNDIAYLRRLVEICLCINAQYVSIAKSWKHTVPINLY